MKKEPEYLYIIFSAPPIAIAENIIRICKFDRKKVKKVIAYLNVFIKESEENGKE